MKTEGMNELSELTPSPPGRAGERRKSISALSCGRERRSHVANTWSDRRARVGKALKPLTRHSLDLFLNFL